MSIMKNTWAYSVPMIKEAVCRMCTGATAALDILPLTALVACMQPSSMQHMTPKGSLEQELAVGNTAGLLHWLRQQIHRHGRYYTSEELCSNATGETSTAIILWTMPTKN
jgi:hypothetical protein